MSRMPLSDRRRLAQEVFAAGLSAADPAAAVRAALGQVPPVRDHRVVLGIGKAACTMVEAALAGPWPDAITPARTQALVVTDDGNAREVAGAEVLVAAHPVPDARGAAAARRVIALARGLGPGDQLVVLVSGGASALLPAPVPGVTLADKIAVSRMLLASGADIGQMNLVRQALSQLKGGGLAQLAAPAQVIGLILSDVMGDDLRVIASGPTVGPVGTAAEAAALLRDLGLWSDLPEAVRRHLSTGAAAPAGGAPDLRNLLIGSNTTSVAAMARAAHTAQGAAGLPITRVDAALTGDVRRAAATIAGHIAQEAPAIVLWGGETTVTLGPWAGRGGRNQELALRVALLAETVTQGAGRAWCFLSAGTDGRDGPTDAAGGMVDETSLARMRQAGCDPAVAAAAHDAYRALAASGDLLRCGATGTNVADLQVLIVA